MQNPLKLEKLRNDSFNQNINASKESGDSLLVENHDFILDLINANATEIRNNVPSQSPNSNLSEFGQFNIYSPKNINENYLTYKTQDNFNVQNKSPTEMCNVPDSSIQNLNSCDQFNQNHLYTSSQNSISLPVMSLSTSNNGFIQYSPNVQYNAQTNIHVAPSQQYVQYHQLSENSNPVSINSVSSMSKPEPVKQLNDDHVRRLERKRERNREAARKCRERKMHHIELLESQLQEQKTAMEVMREKMKLVISEMKRLGEYISINIPQCNIKNINDFLNENDIEKILNSDEYND